MYSGAPADARRRPHRRPHRAAHEDVALWLLKESDEAALKVVRHSAAHVMATAILELFPETKLGHGPATDNGFFYDVYRETPFTEADLAAIEARMAEVVARDEPFVHVEESRDRASPTTPRRASS
jgi:threonyl-tRNA synthetase